MSHYLVPAGIFIVVLILVIAAKLKKTQPVYQPPVRHIPVPAAGSGQAVPEDDPSVDTARAAEGPR